MKKRKYKCKVCGKVFSSRKGLLIHKSKVHGKKRKKELTQKKCWFILGLVVVTILTTYFWREAMLTSSKSNVDPYFMEACKVAYYPDYDFVRVVGVETDSDEVYTNVTCQFKNGETKMIVIENQEYAVYDENGRPLFSIWDKKIKENEFTIHSPLNKTYHEKHIILNVSFTKPCVWIKDRIDGGNLSGITCDGGPCGVSDDLIDNESFVLECGGCYSFAMGFVDFEKGTHEVAFKAMDYNNVEYRNEIVFTVV